MKNSVLRQLSNWHKSSQDIKSPKLLLFTSCPVACIHQITAFNPEARGGNKVHVEKASPTQNASTGTIKRSQLTDIPGHTPELKTQDYIISKTWASTPAADTLVRLSEQLAWFPYWLVSFSQECYPLLGKSRSKSLSTSCKHWMVVHRAHAETERANSGDKSTENKHNPASLNLLPANMRVISPENGPICHCLKTKIFSSLCQVGMCVAHC